MTERKKIKQVPGTCYGSTSCSVSSLEGFLWTEHKTRIMGILPYLRLLLYPPMRFFMPRGQEGHNRRREDYENHL